MVETGKVGRYALVEWERYTLVRLVRCTLVGTVRCLFESPVLVTCLVVYHKIVWLLGFLPMKAAFFKKFTFPLLERKHCSLP